MKILITFIIFSFSSLASAYQVESQIHSFEKGSLGEPHLVKMTDGQVAFIEFGEKSILSQLEKSRARGDWLLFNLNKQHTLESFEIIPAPKDINFSDRLPLNDITDPYVPSVISSKMASTIFKRMSKRYQKKSQCFNRAHIWTYTEFMRSGTNLNKVFLFFTSRYIRKFRYRWWFHVTPMAYVGGNKFRNWKMLDRRYTKGPLSSKSWTDIFIKTKRSCKVVHKFSDYREYQHLQDCYMIPVSQYYLVPSDIEMRESENIIKTSYDEIEVEHARWEAF